MGIINKIEEEIAWYSLTNEAEDLKASLEYKGLLKGKERESAKKRHAHIMKVLSNAQKQGKVTGIEYLKLKKVV